VTLHRIRLAAAVLLALAVLPLARSTSLAQSEPPLIRVGAALDDQSTPLLYAVHADLFKKAGLNVEIEKLGSGSVVAAAVAGGSLEIGKAATYAIILAVAKGLPFTLISPIATEVADAPDGALLVPVNSPIKSAKDLNGKTIGVTTLQDFNMLAVEAWMDQNGGDPSTVKFIELPPPAIAAALEAGRIDGAPVFEPVYTAAVSSGKARVGAYVYTAIAKHYIGAAMFANTAWAASHRDLVERFNRVMLEADRYVGAHESEAIPLIAQFVGVDPALLLKMHHPGRATYLAASEVQPLIDLAAKYKIIAKGFPASQMICDCALKPPR
jgi:ABC-type nitrate/sulfonate/bicarbonate transport system substrate-binding protein